MRKDFLKCSVMLALAAVIWLPDMASADYVQAWSENGQYGVHGMLNKPGIKPRLFWFPAAPGPIPV